MTCWDRPQHDRKCGWWLLWLPTRLAPLMLCSSPIRCALRRLPPNTSFLSLVTLFPTRRSRSAQLTRTHCLSRVGCTSLVVRLPRQLVTSRRLSNGGTRCTPTKVCLTLSLKVFLSLPHNPSLSRPRGCLSRAWEGERGTPASQSGSLGDAKYVAVPHH